MNMFSNTKENERPESIANNNKVSDATITLNKLPDMAKIKDEYR